MAHDAANFGAMDVHNFVNQPSLENIMHTIHVTFCGCGCQQAASILTYTIINLAMRVSQFERLVQVFPLGPVDFELSHLSSREQRVCQPRLGLQLLPSDVARRLKLDCAVALACRRQLCQKLSIGGILTWPHQDLGNVRANLFD